MSQGLIAGLLWGLDTVILGIALAMTPFFKTEEAIFLAPFVSTFIHDFFSSLWMLVYMGAKKQLKKVLLALKRPSGRVVMVAALLGGPLGMTGYVLSIKYLGAAYTAVISSLFPALGAFFSFVFLKEKMKGYQLVGLGVSLFGVVLLGYTPGAQHAENLLLGFFFAMVCVVGWAAEAVIIAHGLKNPDLADEEALQIRQLTSMVVYAVVLLPLLRGWSFSLEIFTSTTMPYILVAALFGTASYLFYYKAIAGIGASKAMALNITYCAWALFFGFVILKEPITLVDVLLSVVIIGGSIVASADLSDFRPKTRKMPDLSKEKAS